MKNKVLLVGTLDILSAFHARPFNSTYTELVDFPINNYNVNSAKMPDKIAAITSNFTKVITGNDIDSVVLLYCSQVDIALIHQIISLSRIAGVTCLLDQEWHLKAYNSYPQINVYGCKFMLIRDGNLLVRPERVVKLWTDKIFAALLIIILFPLLLMIAISVKMTSAGPVLFLHKRIGYKRRIFKMIKFRTMIKDAEQFQEQLEYRNEANGAAFKINNDPRVTRIGRWLRKTSLDELPQLLNVLWGDMSIVGPRPLPVRDFHLMKELWQLRRFSVKPGMTCFWQIKRDYTMPFDDWMITDLKYIDEWNLLLDIKLIIQTIPAVYKGKGI